MYLYWGIFILERWWRERYVRGWSTCFPVRVCACACACACAPNYLHINFNQYKNPPIKILINRLQNTLKS